MLRDNQTIVDLNLRGNFITDEGCRALASVLSSPSSLERIDLRKNRITRKGIKLIVEALERSARVRHVYVHAGGKIEALGQDENVGSERYNSNPSSNLAQNNMKHVNSVCMVDIRDNSKPEDSAQFKEDLYGLSITVDDNSSKSSKGQLQSKKRSAEEVRG